MPDQTVSLGGRKFAPSGAATTARQDDWMMKQVEESGLMELLHLDLSVERNRHAVVRQAIGSGQKFRLLAGVLAEEGQPWSVESAEQNAEFFANLTDPADKDRMTDAFVGILVSFFASGAGSIKTSAPSSAPAGPGRSRTKTGAPGSSAPGRRSRVR